VRRDCPIYVDADTLRKMGQTIPKTLRAPEDRIQALIGFAFAFDRGGPVSDLFKRVVQYAREEAARLGSEYVPGFEGDSVHPRTPLAESREHVLARLTPTSETRGSLRRSPLFSCLCERCAGDIGVDEVVGR